MMKRKAKNLMIGAVILIILVGAIVVGSLYFTQQSVTSSQYISTITTGYYRCQESDITDSLGVKEIPQNGVTVKCPEEALSCEVTIDARQFGAFNTYRRLMYKLCDSNGANCGSEKYYPSSSGSKSAFLWTMPRLDNKHSYQLNWQRILVTFQWQNIKESQDQPTYEVEYKPLYIFRDVSGSSGLSGKVSGTAGCIITSSLYSKQILDFTGIDSKLGITATSDARRLEPDQVVNFLAGWHVEPGFVTEQYNGQLAYCRSRSSDLKGEIYRVEQIETGGYTYNVVNTDANAKLGEVTCCNGESDPTNERICQNHQWKSTAQATCSLINPCPVGEFQIADKTVRTWSCVNGNCEPTDRQVECTDDSHCASNEQCVNWVCEVTGTPGPGDTGTPGDKQTCEEAGGTWITKESSYCGFLCQIGLQQPVKTDESYCKMPTNWLMYAIIGTVFLVILAIIYAVMTAKPPKKKSTRPYTPRPKPSAQPTIIINK